MKTWKQLTDIATQDALDLHTSPVRRAGNSSVQPIVGGVTVMTTDAFPTHLITITAGDLLDEEGDEVIRVALEGALRALKELPR